MRRRHCRICLRCLVCPLICVTLIVIIPAPVLAATPVLPILMALLRACAKVLRTRATISTPHCTGVSHLLILCLLTDIRTTYLVRLAGLG